MANLQMDPVQATEFHIADMFQRSCLVPTVEPLPTLPHHVAIHINYCVGAKGLLIREGLATVPYDPDQAIDLSVHQMFDTQGQEVDVLEVFD